MGFGELVLILVVVVVVFGATKLPHLGGGLGPSVERWRRAQLQEHWLRQRFGREPGRPWTFAEWALVLVAAVLVVAVIANALAQSGR
jgi:TatA/E family protein of Tat protein translocase